MQTAGPIYPGNVRGFESDVQGFPRHLVSVSRGSGAHPEALSREARWAQGDWEHLLPRVHRINSEGVVEATSEVGAPAHGRLSGPLPRTPRSRPVLATVKENVVPSPGVLSTQIRPPCASTIPCAIESPSPDPRRSPLRACQYRSKTWGRCSAGIPGPVSETEKQISCSAHPARRVIVPPSGVNFRALPRRFEKTRKMRCESTHAVGGAVPGSHRSVMDFCSARG